MEQMEYRISRPRVKMFLALICGFGLSVYPFCLPIYSSYQCEQLKIHSSLTCIFWVPDLYSHPWGRPQRKDKFHWFIYNFAKKAHACPYSVLWGQSYQQFKNDGMQTKSVNCQMTEFWNKGALCLSFLAMIQCWNFFLTSLLSDLNLGLYRPWQMDSFLFLGSAHGDL